MHIQTTEDLFKALNDGIPLIECQIEGANISNTIISDVDFQGCDLANIKCKSTLFKNCNFKGAFLCGAELEDVGMLECNLDDTWNDSIKIKNTKMRSISANNADFGSAEIDGLDFELSKNNSFRHSKFKGAKIKNSDLSGVDFRKATFGRQILTTLLLLKRSF